MSPKEQKKGNNRINQQVEEDAFEYNADRNIKRNMLCTKISIKRNKKEGKKETLHEKIGHVSSELDFNSDSESNPSYRDITEQFSRHQNLHDDMAPFDKTPFTFSKNFIFI